jgi:TolA-binding protein
VGPGRTLITDFPEFSQLPEALYYTSECYFKLGDYRKAKDYLRELVNKHTNHPIAQDGFLLLARCQWLDGSPESAQLTLRSMADRFPGSPLRHDGQAVLARIHITMGHFGAAREILEGIPLNEVERQQAAVDILLLKAEAQLRSGDAESAVASAITMLESYPEDAREEDALYLLAEAYEDAEQPLWSFTMCNTLRAQYPETGSDPFLYLTAGRALRKLGLQHRALEWMNEGLERCPEGTRDTFEMYMLLGEILFDLGMYERAKTVFRKTTERQEFEEASHVRYVEAQIEQEDYQGALRTLDQLLAEEERAPSYRTKLFMLGAKSFEALGEMEAAIAAYEGRWPEDFTYGTQGVAAPGIEGDAAEHVEGQENDG